ncbi:FGGY-family carbohydrate kinase [soil metagenome]
MSTYFLAIDGGSQSTKVSVVDETGRVHASSRAPLQAYELGPDGRAVHPGDDLWDTLVDACRTVLASFAGGAAAITAVGLCSIRFCRALMDESGRLTEPVLSWMDDRVSRPLVELDPAVHTVAGAGGDLTLRLTGERRDSTASYQGMWPFDPLTRSWSSSRQETARTGMRRRLLPDLVDPGARLGTLTTAAAAATGLPVGCPVFATANDKAVEALGAGLRDQDTTLLSLGTYVAAMTVGDGRATRHDDYWVNAAAIPGRSLYESAGIRRGMWTASWLRQLVSAGAQGAVDEDALQHWLTVGAARVPAGCDGLMVLPDWLAPTHASHRRGVILGLQASHGAPHLYRAVLEGIAVTMAGHAEAMERALGTAPSRLLVSGGGSSSDLMMQIVADVFARPAQRAGVTDAVAVGAAICAAVGSGVHPDFEAAVAAMTRPGQVFDPVPETRDRYAELRGTFAVLPEFTDPLFRRLARLE